MLPILLTPKSELCSMFPFTFPIKSKVLIKNSPGLPNWRERLPTNSYAEGVSPGRNPIVLMLVIPAKAYKLGWGEETCSRVRSCISCLGDEVVNMSWTVWVIAYNNAWIKKGGNPYGGWGTGPFPWSRSRLRRPPPANKMTQNLNIVHLNEALLLLLRTALPSDPNSGRRRHPDYLQFAIFSIEIQPTKNFSINHFSSRPLSVVTSPMQCYFSCKISVTRCFGNP